MSDTPQGPMRLKMEQYCLNDSLADRIAHLNESERRQCYEVEEALDLATEGTDHWASNDVQQVSHNNKVSPRIIIKNERSLFYRNRINTLSQGGQSVPDST